MIARLRDVLARIFFSFKVDEELSGLLNSLDKDKKKSIIEILKK